MNQPDPTETARALALLEAANFLRDAHFNDGMSVQEIGAALRNTADQADPMVGSLARDGFGLDEIAAMQTPAAPVVPPAPTSQTAEWRAGWCAAADEIEVRQDRFDAERRAEIGELDRDDELESAAVHTMAKSLRRLAAVPAAEEQRGLTADDFARMQAGADVIAGRARLPFNQLPAADQERHRDAARTLLARAAEEQSAPLCAHCGDPISNPTAWISLWTDGQERRYHLSSARPECQPAAEQPDNETPDEDRVVAHVLAVHTALHCLTCAPPPWGDIWTPVTASELEDGGICSVCGADVLIPLPAKEA